MAFWCDTERAKTLGFFDEIQYKFIKYLDDPENPETLYCEVITKDEDLEGLPGHMSAIRVKFELDDHEFEFFTRYNTSSAFALNMCGVEWEHESFEDEDKQELIAIATKEEEEEEEEVTDVVERKDDWGKVWLVDENEKVYDKETAEEVGVWYENEVLDGKRIVEELKNLDNHRVIMDKLVEILEDTETSFESPMSGRKRFSGLSDLEALAEDYKFLKRDTNVVVENLCKKLMERVEEEEEPEEEKIHPVAELIKHTKCWKIMNLEDIVSTMMREFIEEGNLSLYLYAGDLKDTPYSLGEETLAGWHCSDDFARSRGEYEYVYEPKEKEEINYRKYPKGTHELICRECRMPGYYEDLVDDPNDDEYGFCGECDEKREEEEEE